MASRRLITLAIFIAQLFTVFVGAIVKYSDYPSNLPYAFYMLNGFVALVVIFATVAIVRLTLAIRAYPQDAIDITFSIATFVFLPIAYLLHWL